MKWLPAKLRVTINEEGKLTVADLDSVSDDSLPPKPSEQETLPLVSDYELTGVVIFVRDPENEEKHNLVAVIKVPKPFFERANQPPSSLGGWFLFNDFW